MARGLIAPVAAVGAPPEGVCGPRTRIVCAWVYDLTGGDATAAAVADWLLGRPIAIGGVLLAGWVLRWFVRRLVGRGVNRILAQAPVLRRATTSPPRADANGHLPWDEARRAERARAVATAVSSTLSALVWVVTVIAAAGILGLDVGPILASAGLAGVAIAFGAQSLIRDLLAGVFILLEDHFAIGDEVDLGEGVGVVERMTLRETVLRDLDGTVWHVRNGEIDRVGNHSQVWSAAMLDITVAHGTDLATARTVLTAVATEVAATAPFDQEVLEPPEVLGVEALGADGVTLRLLVKTLAGRQFGLQRALLEGIAESFRSHGVELGTRELAVRVRRTAPVPPAD
ncbi:mechanosensitive ion channel family protein [Pseudonocardia humida]|uniref:Mechanosensitive ion channel family protein n=1 Tax=Pseudonocardia humida TaxID=2800819 RepID=A0ABT1AAD0_9PSEU|nr:mechanosensitive ion channel domain-containing protein [Pseudonocardia humida]MCO1659885.1 mechanosensitive ion channel family protein [Pseudonocardia humida]